MKYKKWPLIAGMGCFSAIIAGICANMSSPPAVSAGISAGELINPVYSVGSVENIHGDKPPAVSSVPSQHPIQSPISSSSSAVSSSSTAASSSISSASSSISSVPEAPASSVSEPAPVPEPEPEPAPEPEPYVPEKPYVRPSEYADPDSYLIFDENNWTYVLTPEEEAIGKSSLFVGDSTCYGFSAWNVVPDRNVYAAGGAAARNLIGFESIYYLGRQIGLEKVLDEAKPKRVFFWLGMNDVNMTDEDAYCENYKVIIDTVLKRTKAEVYVCAITPISNLNFTKPVYIEQFNSAVKDYIETNYSERVHTVNFAEPLKDGRGLLDEQYNGGDGIHLRSKAYYVAMHEINRQIRQYESI